MRVPKDALKKVLGVLLVVLGILAFITPLTPGSWLALIGIELLGFGDLVYDYLEKHHPRIHARMPKREKKD